MGLAKPGLVSETTSVPPALPPPPSRWMLYNTPRKIQKMTSPMVTQHVTLIPFSSHQDWSKPESKPAEPEPQSDGRTHVKAPVS